MKHIICYDFTKNGFYDWKGKTKYMGITFTNAYGRYLHGWVKVRVNSNGSEVEIIEGAYDEKPYATVKAGNFTRCVTPRLTYKDELIDSLVDTYKKEW